MKIKVGLLIIVIVMLLSSCASGISSTATSPNDACKALYYTSTNATVSGRIYRCETPDGVLYVYEGIDIEFAPIQGGE